MDKGSGKTLQSGYLEVGDGHELFYETYGNPDGVPVLFLHGGPGVGCSDKDKRFFDADKFYVIFFDQRGAPRSKPVASLKNNTTQKLVEDINKLLNFFQVEKAIFFGGSWGTTLALVYAIQFPHRVISMILRGVFLGTREEINHFAKKGGAVQLFYPEAWERLISWVPQSRRSDITGYYLEQMLSPDADIRRKFIYEWEYYGASAIKLESNPEEIEQPLTDSPLAPSAIILAYYASNNCFLEDNYILKNAGKIEHIPTSIVHGRYDVICPPIYAYRLKERLKKAALFLVKAGHVASEPEIERQLIKELGRHHKMW